MEEIVLCTSVYQTSLKASKTSAASQPYQRMQAVGGGGGIKNKYYI